MYGYLESSIHSLILCCLQLGLAEITFEFFFFAIYLHFLNKIMMPKKSKV